MAHDLVKISSLDEPDEANGIFEARISHGNQVDENLAPERSHEGTKNMVDNLLNQLLATEYQGKFRDNTIINPINSNIGLYWGRPETTVDEN